MAEMLEQLGAASLLEVSFFFLAVNLIIFIGSVTFCWALGWGFGKKRIFDYWEPLRKIEFAAAIGSIFINAVVSVCGWLLWQADWIEIRQVGLLAGFLDCVLMILFMDLGMYVFHRVAHIAWIYRLLHRFHHRHVVTNPISLFVLHPLEVFGFGALMIAFLMLYTMDLNGLMLYLGLNVLFGTIGHSGVEPFPAAWNKVPVLRLLGSSTFHAGHHAQLTCNFGFYTLLWDKIFGTLDPDYESRFTRTHQSFDS